MCPLCPLRQLACNRLPVFGSRPAQQYYLPTHLARHLPGSASEADSLSGVRPCLASRFLTQPAAAAPPRLLWGLGVPCQSTLSSRPERLQTSIYLASSPEVEGLSGKYYDKCRPVSSSKESVRESGCLYLTECCALVVVVYVCVWRAGGRSSCRTGLGRRCRASCKQGGEDSCAYFSASQVPPAACDISARPEVRPPAHHAVASRCMAWRWGRLWQAKRCRMLNHTHTAHLPSLWHQPPLTCLTLDPSPAHPACSMTWTWPGGSGTSARSWWACERLLASRCSSSDVATNARPSPPTRLAANFVTCRPAISFAASQAAPGCCSLCQLVFDFHSSCASHSLHMQDICACSGGSPKTEASLSRVLAIARKPASGKTASEGGGAVRWEAVERLGRLLGPAWQGREWPSLLDQTLEQEASVHLKCARKESAPGGCDAV